MTDKAHCPSWRLRILVARDAAGARRHPALAVRRDLGGAVPHPVASSTPAPSRPRRASRTRTPASSTRASPIPTVAMFEERMRLLEGAEAARATATGMAAVTSALLCFLKAGDHIVAARAHVRLVPLRRRRSCVRASASPARWSTAATRGAWQTRRAAQHQGVLLRDAGQPDARPRRHRRRVARSRTRAGALVHRRQRVRHAPAAEAAEARRRRRRLFRHQAHRRPGPLPRRRRAVLAEVPQGPPAHLPAPDRPGAQPVQRLGDAQGPGDAAAARARAMRDGGEDRRPPGRPEGHRAGAVLRPARLSAGGARQAADDRVRPRS